MKALTTEKKTDGQTYNRAKSDQDSVRYQQKTEPDFVGSGYHPPERFVPLLAKFSHPANATQRVQLFNQLQRYYGNRYVQRVVAAYRSGNVEEEESTLASEIISRKGSRRAFEPGNQAVQRLLKDAISPLNRYLEHEVIQRKPVDETGGIEGSENNTVAKKDNLKSVRFKDDERLQKAYDTDPLMRMGEAGEGVKKLQRALRDLGYAMPISFQNTGDADGIFGSETYQTVSKFQADYKLLRDGIVGRETLGKLDELYSKEQPLPPCPENLQFNETASTRAFVPGKTCQIKTKTPPLATAPPVASLFFISKEKGPKAIAPNNTPEIHFKSKFLGGIGAYNGVKGIISFMQQILNSVQYVNDHRDPAQVCKKGHGVDNAKYYGMEGRGLTNCSDDGSNCERTPYIELNGKGSPSDIFLFETSDVPSIKWPYTKYPEGHQLDLYRHDKFAMYIVWEPQVNTYVPLAHVQWEWKMWAIFSMLSNKKWMVAEEHLVYGIPSQVGAIGGDPNAIHKSPIYTDETCDNQTTSNTKNNFLNPLVQNNFKSKRRDALQLNSVKKSNHQNSILSIMSNPSSSQSGYSFRGGGVACGINCPKPNTRIMIGHGSVGCPVPELQEKLNVWAAKTPFTVPYTPLEVNGWFGSRTETVVKYFQREHLSQVKYIDGIVGPLTWPAVDYEAPGNYGLPVGELTESHGWRTGLEEATMHNWRHRLLPTSTNFFCGWVTESEIGAKDECYESAYPHFFPYLHLTGGLWCIKPNNWWGDDTHGLVPFAVETYRKTAKLPCTITLKQSMRMMQQNGDIEYAVHEMKYIIDKDNVTSKKDGEESTKKWP